MNYLDYNIILPEPGKTNNFLFENITTDFSNPKKAKKINYTKKVAITRFKRDGNDMLFELFLSEIKITSNLSIENIFFLEEIGSVFDEVEVEINDYGKIINILNFKELQDRWKTMQAKLVIDNEGRTVEVYMQNITDLLKEERRLISFFSDYKIFGLYFSSLYRNSYDIERKRKLIDCGKTMITERFYPKDEKFSTYILEGIPVESSENNDFIKYEGIIEYREDQIDLATIEIEKENSTTIYNIYKTAL
ncbi:hypothetical protein [Flavobacterium aquidurense]|uniref:Uncharacterized protein n=1 Tax=Flavobacterium aquidurense TaxID=362413 RepID=A0A0Q1BP84_9FLAO|nr:hypothetical protein [Flavobacterium aquidurense]KQB42746.1 hypothetical protein RC62_3753 [Flavobacterium aquidurense]